MRRTFSAPAPSGQVEPSADHPADSLTGRLVDRADVALASADGDLADRYPGTPDTRQPVHTLYLPAERVHADVVAQMGQAAIAAMDEHLPAPEALLLVFGDVVTAADAPALFQLVRAKLEREPVEDLRIDFEDGFTQRGVPAGARDSDEDAHVDRVLAELLTAHPAALPPFAGLRFGSFDPATRRRGIRTFTQIVTGLADVQGPAAFERFRPTLPKVTSSTQVQVMVDLCHELERECGLPERTLRFEIQVETTQAVCGPDGKAQVAPMIHAADRRCIGLHFGTYDYSAACGIAAAHQGMDHPAADHAKAVMQVAAAGTGVALSDGSTNRLPVGDADAVLTGWRLHARLVDRSLRRGYYQGWDLHPAQLVSRYVATYAYYRRELPEVCARIAAYLGTGAVSPACAFLDEPATARALADHCLRALDCGATTPAEVLASAGVDRPTLERLRRAGVGPVCTYREGDNDDNEPTP